MTAQVQPAAPAESSWTPFTHASFTVLWGATVISNIGTWMSDVGAGWLMTELSPSPLVVAAVQASTTLPVFLFALIAGALADIMDRRRLLIVVNLLLTGAAALLTMLVALGLVTPGVLLLFTFLFGAGAAFIAPAWQAIVPQLVPRADLQSALALNSMGINVSRAIGPALAGTLIVSVGLAAPFAANALSGIAILLALVWWRPTAERQSALPPEQIGGAIIGDSRYVFNSRPLLDTLVRAAAFFVFGSALWSMLPLVARDLLSGGPRLYGLLLASVGAGAVGGALALPAIRRKLGPDRTVAAGTIGVAIAMATLAAISHPAVAALASLLAGLSWIAVLSGLNVSAQTALPDWVRARGLSVFLTVFFGSMAAGSLIWGQVAASLSISAALLISAAGAVAAIPLVHRFRLNRGAEMDLAPSLHWPAPVVAAPAAIDDGPVSIKVTYRVAAADGAEFASLMTVLGAARRRSGAYGWSVMRDSTDADLFVECWFEASWAQHLRHHERVSGADRVVQERVHALHRGAGPPDVAHYLPLSGSAAPGSE